MLLPVANFQQWDRSEPIFSTMVASMKANGSPRGGGATARRTEISVGEGMQEFRHPEFTFRYPGGWRAVPNGAVALRGDQQRQLYFRVEIMSPDGAASVIVHYRKFPREALCGSIAEHLEGLLNVEYTMSYFDQKALAPQQSDAGTVFTSIASRSRKFPDSEVTTSVICAGGRAASVMFYYPVGYPQAARDLVMRTLSFTGGGAIAPSSESLIGDWNCEDGVLTLNADGSAALSYSGGFLTNRGTYAIRGGNISFAWTTILSVHRSTEWNCSYSQRGLELYLGCRPGPSSWRLRR